MSPARPCTGLRAAVAASMGLSDGPLNTIPYDSVTVTAMGVGVNPAASKSCHPRLKAKYCHVQVPEELLKELLPGPVTLVMERSEELNKDLNPFTPLVGIRIPDHAFMQELAQMFGGPLALTSANLSSQASSLKVEEFQDLWPSLSLVIDGGPIGDCQSLECRLGSTVVDLSVPGKFGIIRPGCALESTTVTLQKYRLLPSHGSCS
ncbi:yrdC domain-containing protein, mitochondrial [Fukomys damarensis]|uniref:yrdC domain-containing protein, mitochondrial n=1 Tax=Fukomys damarensis TaxID=885580 RepID=UPI0008FEBEFC|nr:yrdC domain-containing protein, mitochondrial [Fukomys damarensis]